MLVSHLIYTARDFDAISKNLIKFIELPNESVLWIKRFDGSYNTDSRYRAIVQLQ